MANEKLAPTAVDHVTVILSPALIMGLVGSLVFFMLEVLYSAEGPWKERLQWILFFYVFGVVLVGRIALAAESAPRAGMYGAVLALLTYIGMQSLVEYPPEVRGVSFLANLALVGVVWWCAVRLVRDCTHVDEDAEAPAEGLLQAAGLAGKPKEDMPAETDEKGRPLGWIERYRLWRQKASKSAVLGKAVVWFSLAALPIFGLGQALISVDEPGRRRVTFWLMTVYVGCALGLLLTTCFLGLRRYLRQRRLRMPAAMTTAWLASGGVLLVGLLLIGALLPRPYPEYPWLTPPLGSHKARASKFASKGTGAEGEGAKEGKQGKQSEKEGKQGDGKGKQSEGKGKQGDGKGKQSDGKGKQGDGKGKQSDGKAKQGDGKGKQSDGKGKQGDHRKPADKASQGGRSASSWQRVLDQIGSWIKWVMFAVLAVVVAAVVAWNFMGILANFSGWAKRWMEWWRKLWAGLAGAPAPEAGDDAPVEAVPESPFSAYADPFASGKAEGMPPRELLRYVLAALEAWARDRGVDRRDDETANEFIARLSEEFPAIETEGRRMVALHGRAEYGGGTLPSSTLDTCRALWRQMSRMASARVQA